VEEWGGELVLLELRDVKLPYFALRTDQQAFRDNVGDALVALFSQLQHERIGVNQENEVNRRQR
jgi:hypothetical protein